MAKEDITLAGRRLRHPLTTLDKCCEAFVQESPDAKPVIDLMGGALQNIIKHLSAFKKPND